MLSKTKHCWDSVGENRIKDNAIHLEQSILINMGNTQQA